MKPSSKFFIFIGGCYLLMILGAKEIVDIIVWSFNHG